jgi:hypothetical protein
MPKESGLGDNLYVGGYNLSGDIGSLGNISGGLEPLPSTGIDKYAPERMGGIRDGHIEFTSWFNPDAAHAHVVLSALTTSAADVHVQYWRGTTLGAPVAAMVAKETDYAPTRGEDGSLVIDSTFDANGYGLEWGLGLTAGAISHTTGTNGSSIDYGAGVGTTAFGAQAWFQLHTFTGTLAAIEVQHSSDNGVGDAFAAVGGLSFSGSVAAARSGTRTASTTRTTSVERYLRVSTSGVFTEMTFSLMVVKNLTAVTDG